jgi:hypothetical protein
MLSARQRFSEQIPKETNAQNNRMFIARQRRGKHTSSTIQAVFPTWSVPRGLKGLEAKNWLAVNRQSWSNSDPDFDFGFDFDDQA